mmetsp:Transcript_32699/g.76015  ORF Transcript_32699/g.76015 Transcript_32699/m.76015 type:complete len:447 (-) Transcript_32699:111-1451(-)
MGGTTSKGEPLDLPTKPCCTPNTGKPFFFLASCPDDVLDEASTLAETYGGFHCVGERSDDFAAWKGKAEGQFLTLKRLSPAGRKVVGIAIAGFDHCNDERQFLQQLGKKHEQFELKQCGDVRDMERWLLSEGYGPAQEGTGATASAAPRSEKQLPAASKEGPAGLFSKLGATVHASLMGGVGGGAAAASQEERRLMDALQALEESQARAAEAEVTEPGAEALRNALQRLRSALSAALAAGVPKAELHTAEAREKELEQLIRVAEARQSACKWCCCCAAADEWNRVEETHMKYERADAERSTLMDERDKGKCDRGKTPPHLPHLAMRTVLPSSHVRDLLPVGTKCRYKSARNGWLDAFVEGFNPSDGTCNLDVRQHAKLKNIFPAADVPQSKAWPSGTLVEYESSSAGHWLEATVLSFNEGSGSKEGSYNLDLREHASVDRIRLRLA